MAWPAHSARVYAQEMQFIRANWYVCRQRLDINVKRMTNETCLNCSLHVFGPFSLHSMATANRTNDVEDGRGGRLDWTQYTLVEDKSNRLKHKNIRMAMVHNQRKVDRTEWNSAGQCRRFDVLNRLDFNFINLNRKEVISSVSQTIKSVNEFQNRISADRMTVYEQMGLLIRWREWRENKHVTTV